MSILRLGAMQSFLSSQGEEKKELASVFEMATAILKGLNDLIERGKFNQDNARHIYWQATLGSTLKAKKSSAGVWKIEFYIDLLELGSNTFVAFKASAEPGGEFVVTSVVFYGVRDSLSVLSLYGGEEWLDEQRERLVGLDELFDMTWGAVTQDRAAIAVGLNPSAVEVDHNNCKVKFTVQMPEGDDAPTEFMVVADRLPKEGFRVNVVCLYW
ncbi:hypothetical protein [Ktedonospora formicarum]|uniref:Uncharacterized protein n=1 Tax=Ktedonospora formicarum TaxID=2778364 RepID=A0A8J3I9Q0_9CHLR|nr:hypothetical protein [Ktedonospora formicarum]GHO48064.1 hypothetical protein KSX_62270 [Ktedonospora formicarum]